MIHDDEAETSTICAHEGKKISCIADSDVEDRSLLGKDSVIFLGKDPLYVSADDDALVRIEAFDVKSYSEECDVYLGTKDKCFFGMNGGDASLFCLSVK